MGAKVSFLKEQSNTKSVVLEGVIVPSTSVMKEGASSFVFLIKNGIIVKTKVQVESTSANYARIINGIKNGDSVVINSNNGLQDGQEVVIK